MKFEAIIFDVGDTLLSYNPDEYEVIIWKIETAGIKVNHKMKQEMKANMINASYKQLEREQNGAQRIDDKEFIQMLIRSALECCVELQNISEFLTEIYNIPTPHQELEVMQDVIGVLDYIKGKKYKLGIVSNHRIWLPDFLKKKKLDKYFDVIVISDIVGIEKPDPQIMKIAMNNLSIDKSERCLYVGDHPFDVLCSKKAGMKCAWLAPCDAKLPKSIPYIADYKLSRLSEIIGYV